MKSVATLLFWGVLAQIASAAELEPGLVGEYFTYRTEGYVPTLPEGARPFLVRVDGQVNFPDPGTGGDFHKTKLVYNFAVRWSGVLRVEKAGEYTFFTSSDDGARLTVGDKVVVENDGPHPLSEKAGKVQLAAGDHAIKLEFAQGGGGSACILLWQPPGGEKEVVPATALFHEKAAVGRIAWDEKAWREFKPGGGRRDAGPHEDNTQWGRMDYGPFLSHTISAPEPADNVTLKGVAVKLDGGKAGVLFDTQNMRLSAAWTGGFLQLKGVAFDGAHGPSPEVGGGVKLATRRGPGWARPGSGDFTDPRADASAPLPKDWLHFKGLYRHGERVVFSYSVGGTDVLELPAEEGDKGEAVFTRSFSVAPSAKSLTLLVAEMEGGGGGVGPVGQGVGELRSGKVAEGNAVIESGDSVVAATLVAPRTDESWEVVQNATWEVVAAAPTSRIHLTIPPHARHVSFKVITWRGEKRKLPGFAGVLLSSEDPRAFAKGGPALWPQVIAAKGKLGTASATEPNAAAYVVDTVEPPFQNPWNSWIRFGGFDFFPDGRSAALCTWSGDVWVVSGLDEKLEKLTWKRFAAGLFQPLGLKIVDGKVYVHGRDQITRLHDLNNDGEADFYESFNNDLMVTPGFHEFNFDLHTDPAGNFYLIKAGPVNPGGGGFGRITPHNGSLLRVSKDGSKLDVVATGFRAPNGMGVGPNGELTSGDNQGTWTPVCRLNWIREGGFYGVVDLAHRATPPKQTNNPLCWLPYAWDNSSGSQVWVSGGKWGTEMDGDLLHLSYGKCKLFKVLIDKTDPQNVQGGVVRLPLKFDSGVMRARVNPADGQVWVCGLRGWQTDAATDACFQRVRYTGKPVYLPDGMKVRPDGIEITFTQPLDEAVANDPGSFGVERWNYRWTGEYGSAEYSVKDPSKTGRDEVEVKSAKLLADGKTVFLEIADFKPVMQMLIKYDLEAKDRTVMRDEIACTINVVGNKKMVVTSEK